jgi:hypothetical protein
MIRSYLAVAILLLSVSLNGQAPFPSGSDIALFTRSRTCIVLDDDQLSPYNSYIRKGIASFWTITPYEFISAAEFEEKRRDPAFSFIILTQNNFERDKSGSAYTFINLLQGKNLDELGKMPEICAVPLSSADEDDLDYGYKIGAILSFMQKHASMIAKDPSLTGRRYLRYYNRHTPEIHTRKILVRQEDLAPGISTIEKIREFYGSALEIVTEEEIVKAIEGKAAGTIILHKVGPVNESSSGYCYKMLIGTDDANMYYYNQHTINASNPNALLPADLKRMAAKN